MDDAFSAPPGLPTDSPLSLPFKGSRTYLHGSDIVPALFKLTGAVQKPSFQFHRMATRPLAARRVSEPELAALRRDGQLVVLMAWRNEAGGNELLAVVESGRAEPIPRVPFDENTIVSQARLGEQTIRHAAPGSAGFMERVIALHKALLNQVVGTETWVFSRLDLAHGPVEATEIGLSFSRAMGTQVFKSDIEGDGQPLGALYFSRSAA